MEDIERNTAAQLRKKSFKDASTNEKLAGINVLNAKWTIVEENVSFFVHFYLDIYSFSGNTFRI